MRLGRWGLCGQFVERLEEIVDVRMEAVISDDNQAGGLRGGGGRSQRALWTKRRRVAIQHSLRKRFVFHQLEETQVDVHLLAERRSEGEQGRRPDQR
jgi:hypothetical protein